MTPPSLHQEIAHVERSAYVRQSLAADRRITRGGGMSRCDAVWYETYRALAFQASRSMPPGTTTPAWAQANYEHEWRRLADQARADCLANGLRGLGEIDRAYIVNGS